jgi:hypothetical protein
MPKILIICLVLSSSFAYGQAHFPFTKNLRKKGYEFRLNYNQFTTLSNFDDNGNEVALQTDESYTFSDVDLYGSYGYSSNLQFQFGMRYRNISSTELGPLDSNLHDLTTDALHSSYASMRYAYNRVGNMLYTLELGYRYRGYSNPTYISASPNNNLATGDEGGDIHMGLILTYKPKSTHHFISSKVFYQNPGSNLSSHIAYAFEGALVWKYFALIAGVDGISSLGNDEYGGNSSGKPVLSTGPSTYFNAINPEYQNAYAGLNISFGSNFRAEFRGAQTFGGRSTDKARTVAVNLVYRNDNPSGVNSVVSSFKNYSIEGEVTKVSSSRTMAVVNLGLSDGVNKGMRIDFYQDDFLGSNKLIAAGVVRRIGASSCIVQLTNYYTIDKLSTGIAARAGR